MSVSYFITESSGQIRIRTQAIVKLIHYRMLKMHTLLLMIRHYEKTYLTSSGFLSYSKLFVN